MSESATIATTVAKIKKGDIQAAELVDKYLQRAESANPSLGAYIRLRPEKARAEAREIDARISAGEDVGPLAGIPVAIKDNMNLTGEKITAGSRILEDFRAPFTATAVDRLRAAGAVVIGIANMDEFAMGSSTENSAYLTTRNPVNPEFVPGGSSGGSAAAVAAELAMGALGSDTGGSIRLPAAFCGTVGLKPTYGRVSRYGLIAYASSLDQIGPFANSVEDVALLYDAIAGFDELDSTSLNIPVESTVPSGEGNLEGVKVGVPREFFGDGFDSRIRSDILSAVRTIEDLGAEVQEISLPTLSHALAAYYLIACAEASANLERYDGVRYGHRAKDATSLHAMMERSRSEGFGTEVQRRILLGTYILSAGYYEAYYLKAQKVRSLIKDDFARAFAEVDVIAGPVSPVPPFRLGERLDDPLAMYLTDVATVSANLAGIPAISIPCGNVEGLPTGLQLMGNHLQERLLLKVAGKYEKARDSIAEGGSDTTPFEVHPETLESLNKRSNAKNAKIPIERIAELAALSLDEGHKGALLEDIGEIIDYVDLLDEIETDGIEPTIHPVPSEQHLRDDRSRQQAGEGLLANAPELKGTAFKIPGIME